MYRNDGDANFTDVSYEMHIAEGTIPFLGWGTAFLDYDNDGWKDLVFVNGHVYRDADVNPWGTTWAQRLLLFRITSRESDWSRCLLSAGTALATARSSRGLAGWRYV